MSVDGAGIRRMLAAAVQLSPWEPHHLQLQPLQGHPKMGQCLIWIQQLCPSACFSVLTLLSSLLPCTGGEPALGIALSFPSGRSKGREAGTALGGCWCRCCAVHCPSWSWGWCCQGAGPSQAACPVPAALQHPLPQTGHAPPEDGVCCGLDSWSTQ